ncbi:hypothetical protein [Chitinophaga sp. sic0106]|uniref:hypothetical protein n=1 Tax=Chitinophaga sp. sic0106 TaxID=2854785 RepID=UPI001C4374FB|nr:hypothetical protein [Chitinophaga sp. sic0106]MBV7531033.1 hypothetical protein [Chitinophaga sp. sic0106]
MKKYSLYLLISLPLTAALVAIAGSLTANKNLLIEVLVRLLVFAYTTLWVALVDVKNKKALPADAVTHRQQGRFYSSYFLIFRWYE